MSLYQKVKRPLGYTLLIILLVFVYGFSLRVTEADFFKLVTSAPKARQILDQLLVPDLVSRESETYLISLDFPIPCGSAPEGEPKTSGPRIEVEPGCAAAKEKFKIRALGLGPNTEATVRWTLANGQEMNIKNLETDDKGEFELELQARPIAAAKDGKAARLEVIATVPGGKIIVSKSLKDVVDAMFVTIFMALLATTFGTIFAIPLSFLAASNITRRGPVGTAIYLITRGFLNLVRAYEPLVMATIFALLVGFGSPFAGVLALVIVTMASLGKMFSESVESIDLGPIEALTATGANRLQVVIFSVIPQIIPDFLSYTIYHWDINVRISTIIGFVGGGGIGYYLSQTINTFEYHKAGTALLAIIIVVWSLDFLSAQARKALV